MGKGDLQNQEGSHANTLRTLIVSEREHFIPMAYALSALFQRGGLEDPALDAMPLGVPR